MVRAGAEAAREIKLTPDNAGLDRSGGVVADEIAFVVTGKLAELADAATAGTSADGADGRAV